MRGKGELEDLEFDLLVEAVRRRWGTDFSGYARSSLKRRVRVYLSAAGHESPARAIPAILESEAEYRLLLGKISVPVTEMFRDPPFFSALRELALPWLATHPRATLWCAGCATGEEALSLAILLEEEGLGERCRIYATDFNDALLAQARSGRYPLHRMRTNSANYHEAGGSRSLADYYRVEEGEVRFDPLLLSRISYANHNLVHDSAFASTHLVVCRNVLIYFAADLQARAARILDEGLCSGGFLCLGASERIPEPALASRYEEADGGLRIFRKRGHEQSC